MIYIILIYLLSAVGIWVFVHVEGKSGNWKVDWTSVMLMLFPIANTVWAIIFWLLILQDTIDIDFSKLPRKIFKV